MPREFPPSLLSRVSFLLGTLYFRALDVEAGELEQLDIDVKQQAVLTLLADEGPMTQLYLGQRLGIDRTTIVAVVDGLDDMKLVERRRNPEDRRAYLLTLTASGQQARRRGQDLVAKAESRLLAALSESERRTLTELLARAVEGPR